MSRRLISLGVLEVNVRPTLFVGAKWRRRRVMKPSKTPQPPPPQPQLQPLLQPAQSLSPIQSIPFTNGTNGEKHDDKECKVEGEILQVIPLPVPEVPVLDIPEEEEAVSLFSKLSFPRTL